MIRAPGNGGPGWHRQCRWTIPGYPIEGIWSA